MLGEIGSRGRGIAAVPHSIYALPSLAVSTEVCSFFYIQLRSVLFGLLE
jgi:hypothetical protein